MNFEIIRWAVNEPAYAWRRLTQQTAAIFRKKYRFPLKDIVLFFTFHCDLRCTMCPLWGETSPQRDYDPKNSSRVLPLPLLINLVNDAAPFLPTFLFSGGEPLLYPHWQQLASYIHKKGLHCNLQTNGSLLASNVPDIVHFFQFINVSLDGLSAHDAIRGREGSFAKICQGLDALELEKQKKRKLQPRLNVAVTIGPENCDEVGNLLSFLDHSQWTISSVVLSQREFNDTSPYDALTTQKLVHAFSALRKERWRFPVYFRPNDSNEGIRRYLTSPNSYLKKKFRACPYPYYEIFVHPDGSVWTCPSTEIGNLFDEPFLEMWHRIRKKALQDNLFQTLSLCKRCQGEIAMYSEGAQRMRRKTHAVL